MESKVFFRGSGWFYPRNPGKTSKTPSSKTLFCHCLVKFWHSLKEEIGREKFLVMFWFSVVGSPYGFGTHFRPLREVFGCQECNLITGDDGFLHDAEDCAEESIYFAVFFFN